MRGLKEKRKKDFILVVEESDLVMKVLYTILDYFFEIDWALDGVDGLKLLKKNRDKYDIILTNHTMPRIKGVDFIKEAKRLYPSLPVVCFVDDILDAPEVLNAGADAFVIKPFHIIDLVRVLRRQLGYKDTDEELKMGIVKGRPV